MEHNEIMCLFQLQCQNDNLQDDLDVYKEACEEHKAEVERVTEDKLKVHEELQSAANEVRSLVWRCTDNYGTQCNIDRQK